MDDENTGTGTPRLSKPHWSELVSRKRLCIGLLALSPLGIAIAWLLSLDPMDGYGEPNPPAISEPSSTPKAPSPSSSLLVARILERPLFSRERREGSDAAIAEAAPDELPRLAAILIGPEGRRAVFDPGANAKPIRVTEGATLAGRQVMEIRSDGVRLVGKHGEEILVPHYPPPPKRAIPAQAARPAASGLSLQPGLNQAPLASPFATPRAQAGASAATSGAAED